MCASFRRLFGTLVVAIWLFLGTRGICGGKNCLWLLAQSQCANPFSATKQQALGSGLALFALSWNGLSPVGTDNLQE